MPKVPISIEARAELKTTIPAAASGRFVDALTDILRPFSEARGLRADQIRLQREDVLFEIAKKARARLEMEGKLPGPIPNRVLVPFLEKASLSDLESETLTTAWANILASASKGVKANHAVFVDILGSLDSVHLKFLAFLAQPENFDLPSDSFLDIYDLVDVRRGIEARLQTSFGGSGAPSSEKNADEFATEVVLFLRGRGSCLIAGGFQIFFDGSEVDYFEVVGERDFETFPENVSGALEALNLIKRIEIRNLQLMNISVWVDFHVLTLFGYEFFYACHSGSDPFDPNETGN